MFARIASSTRVSSPVNGRIAELEFLIAQPAINSTSNNEAELSEKLF